MTGREVETLMCGLVLIGIFVFGVLVVVIEIASAILEFVA